MQAILATGLAKTVGADRLLFSALELAVEAGEIVIGGTALGPLDEAARTRVHREKLGFVF